jgi:hypothetical protein
MLNVHTTKIGNEYFGSILAILKCVDISQHIIVHDKYIKSYL